MKLTTRLLLIITVVSVMLAGASCGKDKTNKKEPEKIEQDLLKLFSKNDFKDINHLFVWHGRNTCIARKPKCETCPIKNFCNNYLNNK